MTLVRAPLISCLMLSKDRVAMAARAMRFYRDQTYPRLELVVVSQGTADYVEALEREAAAIGIDHVRIVPAGPALTLGALRNIALDAAEGAIVCQWDDDDCYHRDRVLRQYEQLDRDQAGACYLIEHLHLLQARRRLFWTDWTLREQRHREYRVFPPTVMMVPDAVRRYPEQGAIANRGEDQAMAAQLFDGVPVTTVAAMPWLYLYVFHGSNQMSEDHHEALTAVRSAPGDRIRPHATVIGDALRYFGIEPPIEMCDAGGTVFHVD